MSKTKDIVKGIEFGFCRICNKYLKLSDDHVPPKACGNLSPVRIVNDGQTYISQNGAKFHTICIDCNNAKLGEYDKELAILYKEFDNNRNILTQLDTQYYGVKINPIKILRSISGHLIATYIGKNVAAELEKPVDNSEYFEELRKFANGDLNITDNVDFYYWYYPFDEIRVVQYISIAPDIRNGFLKVSGAIFKFFPIGVFAVNKNSSDIGLPLRIMPQSDDPNYLLKFDIKRIFRIDKFEVPENAGVVIGSSELRFDIEKKH
jgi:hypothetical protein